MTTFIISLPDSLGAFVEAQVTKNGYDNASEYISGILREMRAKKKTLILRALPKEGLIPTGNLLDVDFRPRLKAEREQQILEKYKVIFA